MTTQKYLRQLSNKKLAKLAETAAWEKARVKAEIARRAKRRAKKAVRMKLAA